MSGQVGAQEEEEDVSSEEIGHRLLYVMSRALHKRFLAICRAAGVMRLEQGPVPANLESI